MDTNEHTEVGNALRFTDWSVLKGNPYLSFDDKGVMYLELQGIQENGLPEQLDLKVSTGVVVAMSGDYFGGKEVDLKLPSISEFKRGAPDREVFSSVKLGEYLINEPATQREEQKLINSYHRLANPSVSKDEIDTIYAINNANYIPFSDTLNGYAQELMFALRVKNYGEMLNRNLSHFTPWSIRAYVLGHHIALKYARICHELGQLITNPEYKSDNEDFNTVLATLQQTGSMLTPYMIQDLVYRYQVLALGMELFCFHYYTDHYAAGHGSMVGDLRSLLPENFGFLGGILVNNIHDELNRVAVYTKKPYDPTPDPTDPPVAANGDGDFDSAKNYYNKLACIAGMQESMQDLNQVFQGNAIPIQAEYGGLERLPDIDVNYRQPQPLFLLSEDNKIYYRTELSKIRTLSPSDMVATYTAPEQNGYTELSSTFMALLLVVKLRVFSYFYQGEVQPLTSAELSRIEEEERQLNPGRKPIPQQPTLPQDQGPVIVPQWQKPASSETMMKGLHRNGLLGTTTNAPVNGFKDELEPIGLGL